MEVIHLRKHPIKMGSNGILLQLMLVGLGLVLATSAAAATATTQSKADCPDKCGNVTIPYPFGTKPGCYLNNSFLITCNDSLSPPKPFWRSSDWDVTNISFDGQLQILKPIFRLCSAENDTQLNSPPQDSWGLSRFFISNTQNEFFVIGCDTQAHIQGFIDNDYYATECNLFCSEIHYENESCCSSNGCCELSIPQRLWGISVTLSNTSSANSDGLKSNSCSYAFVVDKSSLKFSDKFVKSLQKTDKLPLVLDWAIGNETCEVARRNQSTYACKGISTCIENDNGAGYRCRCPKGYQGNPYLNGCVDIDECGNPTLNNCVNKESCVNTAGNYDCSCPKRYVGDGRSDGKGCDAIHAKSTPLQAILVALGVSTSLLVLLLGSSWLYWGLKQRKLTKLKEKFFQQNGGLMLQQQLSKHEGSVEGSVKIFTAKELKRATNNYHESRVLGQGGQGTVYKGILLDNRTVAIKKSKIGDESQVQQFINEVIVLSQINHRNVVKLLGCCLETQVPLLVYEFVPNGTLFQHIHNESHASSIPWETRLKIAMETAGALSYLHSVASTPIVHRDVKTTNILLDENYIAKVSDFGASRLIPLDKSQLTTLVQGTLGYLDPEYFHTSQLTAKSDVYSFGVVLVELLTGKMALSFERPEEERNLATYFISLLKEGHLFEVLDGRVLNDGNVDQLKQVAILAKRCLTIKGEERPTMKEVAMELEGLRAAKKTGVIDAEETEVFPGKVSNTYGVGSSRNTAEYDSIRKQVISAFDDGR